MKHITIITSISDISVASEDDTHNIDVFKENTHIANFNVDDSDRGEFTREEWKEDIIDSLPDVDEEIVDRILSAIENLGGKLW